MQQSSKTVLVLVLFGVARLTTACSNDKPAVPSTQPAAQSATQPGAPSTVALAPSQVPPEQISRNLAQSTLSEIQHLRENISLDAWKPLHPGNSMEIYAYGLGSYPNEEWCARMTSESPLGSDRKVKQTAYFYLPLQPDPPLPPAEVPPQEAIGQCRLGFLWTEFENTDPSSEDAVVDGLRKSIAATMGTGKSDVKLDWMGSANWRKTAIWNSGDISVVAAIRYGVPNNDHRALFLVGASAANSGLHFQRDAAAIAQEHDASLAVQKIVWSRIDEAITIAGLGGVADSDFRAAFAIIIGNDLRSPTASQRSTILNAIDAWVTAARALPPPRQAAALFAADQLLDVSGELGWKKDTKPVIRQHFEKQAAKFSWLDLDNEYEYRHSWLQEASQLDPDGRAGEFAFLALMERGFETSHGCLDQHGEGFRAVIAKGEDYLRRKPDSPIRPDVHFMMAQAYGDIVDLATGGGPEGPELKYQSEIASARARAIEYYRMAFAAGANTQRARTTWPEAWRLTAGLPPASLHFFCYYD